MRLPVHDPEERVERLLQHVRRGWRRVCAKPEERARARLWLEDHPSGWTVVDELWSRALAAEGPLSTWLEDGAEPDSWPLEVPLHSLLASHPFACLSPWSSPARSSPS